MRSSDDIGATQLPDAIGPFRVTGMLGSGGMGVVYRGEHRDSGVRAAIKTIRSPSPSLVSSIRREIHSLGRLRHPGIVNIIGSGTSTGLPWYAMDYLEGRTLRDYLNLRHLEAENVVQGGVGALAVSPTAAAYLTPPSTAAANLAPASNVEPDSAVRRAPRLRNMRESLLKIVTRLCDSLAYMHANGIVHRDLKPENIFVRSDGQPVLVDLGISVDFAGTRGREALDGANAVRMGTWAYMAPEQVRGELVDARADLYALGCILYECVTGQAACAGSSGAEPCSLFSTKRPLPPSYWADDVPVELDRLVLQLLEEEPENRLGYADLVARALSEVVAEPSQVVSSTSSVTYLYRPPFIGRASAMHRVLAGLRALEQRAHGGVVLVGGESGVGKTRFVMEVAVEAARQKIVAILGQCSSLALGTEARSKDAALSAFAPLLLAVADHCRQHGNTETIRLLGPNGQLLAAYQPALRDVPGFSELPVPVSIGAREARARVLATAAKVILAFSATVPTLLVIDDLQWADELSLALLRELMQQDLQASGLFVIGAYRTDEANENLRGLVNSPNSIALELARFGEHEVRTMIQGMLALRDAEPPFIDYLTSHSNGNPYFVVEYLRALIAEQVLRRDHQGRWRVASDPQLSLPTALPDSISELIHRRLSRLDPASRCMVAAASVLGREFDGDILLASVDIDEHPAVDVLDVLREQQVVEEGKGGRIRFIHDGLREVAYSQLTSSELVQFHEQAAAAIEGLFGGQDREQHFGDLGFHYSKAKKHATAARYFELAGEKAKLSSAIASAVDFYQQALAEASVTDSTEARQTRARLNEALGELLLLDGQASAARVHIESAVRDTESTERLSGARRLRKLGRVLERQHLHREALETYGQAERILGVLGTDASPSEWHEFVQIQVDAASDLYFLGKVDELDGLVARVQHSVEKYGDAPQRSRFFTATAQSLVKRARYRVTERALHFTALALASGEQCADRQERAMAQFARAFPLMLFGDFANAETLYRQAIDGATQVGDTALLTRALSYWAICLRQMEKVTDCRTAAERALELAKRTQMKDYTGVAHANLAWSASRNSDAESLVQHVNCTFDAWSQLPSSYVFPLQWIARLPYAVHLAANGNADATVAQLEFLLREDQQRLTDDVATEMHNVLCEYRDGKRCSFERLWSLSRAANYL